MAVYKVIQDIEAEDKLLGPLTLKQFIFAAISCGFIFAAFMIATRIKVYAAIPLLPFIIVPAILAAPFGRDQPTDIWLAALIRFWFKPRKRIWDQNDVKHLVTITVPKKVEKHYSDNLTQGEVRSRLKVLADTIDSRGWAAKNAGYFQPVAQINATQDDRLLNPYMTSVAVSPEDLPVYSGDIMDPAESDLAQKFDKLTKQAEQTNMTAAVNRMNASAKQNSNAPNPDQKEDYYFMRQPDQNQVEPDSAMFDSAIIKPSTKKIAKNEAKNKQPDNTDDQELLAKLKEHKQQALQQAEMTTPHHKVIKTPAQLAKEEKENQQKAKETEQAQAVTPLKNPDIVNLSQDDDLSVATIASLANRKPKNTNLEGEIKLR